MPPAPERSLKFKRGDVVYDHEIDEFGVVNHIDQDRSVFPYWVTYFGGQRESSAFCGDDGLDRAVVNFAAPVRIP